jgi:predicted Ser/Thr protein kinase
VGRGPSTEGGGEPLAESPGRAHTLRSPMDIPDEFHGLQRALAGRFSLERELGRGGMGIVFLARDVALDRRVAIKLLPPALATQREYKGRFLREARTAAGLSHPNIVPIHLVEEKDGLVYFVMAFVDGESLGERVRRAGPLKPADAAKLVQEVAWALAHAHGRGVIHRDIKPDNILIDGGSGRAMVTDFGIARVTTTGTLSQQGDVIGTLQYMSPEQASATAVIDGRADLYSLGVTAFFALTGRLPFDSDNPAALVAMHVVDPAPPVLSVQKHVPAKLAEAVDRCLAKDPAARHASGEALAEAIADAQVTHREIAPSIRAFLGTATSAPLQLGGLGLIWLFIRGWVSGLPPGPVIDSIVGPLLALLGLIAGIVAVRPVFAARGVVRAGLDVHDVGEAAAVSVMERDENVEEQQAQVVSLSRPWARGIMLSMSVGPLWLVFDVLRNIARWREGMGSELFLIAVMGAVGTITLATAIRPDLVIGVLSGGSPAVAGLARRFWKGLAGRAVFTLAGLGLRKGKSLPAPESTPTEVLLGRAAEGLFEQLSKDQRARVADVPAVLKRLERVAVSLRARRDELTKALADVGEPGGAAGRSALVSELGAAKAGAERRLADAVTALENLRLDLLRLRAGVGHSDGLTASLEEAKLLGESVDAELAGRAEVEALTSQRTDG